MKRKGQPVNLVTSQLSWRGLEVTPKTIEGLENKNTSMDSKTAYWVPAISKKEIFKALLCECEADYGGGNAFVLRDIPRLHLFWSKKESLGGTLPHFL